MKRYDGNPIVTPGMLKPTADGLEVTGAFNAGAAVFGDEIILLLRVAERCRTEPGTVAVPVYGTTGDERGGLEIRRFRADDPDLSLKDTRGIVYKGIDYLSTVSTIRVARSGDGVNFTVADRPLIYPRDASERYGCEDARVGRIDGLYYINYTAVSEDGWATALCSTRDFDRVERKGIIFYPPNKDVCLFPRRVGGRYLALHRPHNAGFGNPSIWISSSPDLLNWGGHQCLIRPRDNKWERIKIGGGHPPIETRRGWLELYHGKGDGSVYSLFALLLDLDDPTKVLARGEGPILVPETKYETEGFFPNVVFTNGVVERPEGMLNVYYGACDETVNLAVVSVDEILGSLT